MRTMLKTVKAKLTFEKPCHKRLREACGHMTAFVLGWIAPRKRDVSRHYRLYSLVYKLLVYFSVGLHPLFFRK